MKLLSLLPFVGLLVALVAAQPDPKPKANPGRTLWRRADRFGPPRQLQCGDPKNTQTCRDTVRCVCDGVAPGDPPRCDENNHMYQTCESVCTCEFPGDDPKPQQQECQKIVAKKSKRQQFKDFCKKTFGLKRKRSLELEDIEMILAARDRRLLRRGHEH